MTSCLPVVGLSLVYSCLLLSISYQRGQTVRPVQDGYPAGSAVAVRTDQDWWACSGFPGSDLADLADSLHFSLRLPTGHFVRFRDAGS